MITSRIYNRREIEAWIFRNLLIVARFFLLSCILGSGFAFQTDFAYNPKGGSLLHSKLTISSSYSDDWLLSFHNQAQNEKQSTTESLALWNAEQKQDQKDILEWQESFQRNGFADFTPPMSAGLNCLMIGGNVESNPRQPQESSNLQTLWNPKLPWEEESGAEITSLGVISSSDNQIELLRTKSNGLGPGPVSIDTYLVSPGVPINTDPTVSTKIRANDGKRAAVYDCIVDQGLMGAILNSEDTVRELLLEAAVALREHGIYVLVTQRLSNETKGLLEKMSIEAGLEWSFELDGISNDGSQVSVARRFNTGKMPKIGKLSRFQPEF
ncbi:hypothetical protein IV203_002273 [Nitzschia inconspicua]|uniref:Uncharacterized protein n=1 Tax=Nitzschia inconspicua TaxID=303405 RepID=A0A9K3L9U8_9STRA|nr:hypothetical protein IV203_002273 [Nitzschia inconspicua]